MPQHLKVTTLSQTISSGMYGSLGVSHPVEQLRVRLLLVMTEERDKNTVNVINPYQRETNSRQPLKQRVPRHGVGFRNSPEGQPNHIK